MASDGAFETVSTVVGRNVRRLRGDRSQNEIAAFVRVAGLPWSQQVIASIEAGERQLDLGEAVLLAAGALGVGVLELLAGEPDDVVRLSGTTSAYLEEVRYLASHESASRNMRTASAAQRARWGFQHDQVDRRVIEELAPDYVDDPDVDKYIRAMGNDAEQRAASRLGVAPVVVTAAAFGLWGHSMTEERDRRTSELAGDEVTPASRQAFRGRVTRQLLAELKARIQEVR